MFFNYPKVNSSTQGDDPYADARNHCTKYDYFSVRGERVTSVHECTHGINSQIRNTPVRRGSIPVYSGDPLSESVIVANSAIPTSVHACCLPQPVEVLTPEEESMKMMITGKMNGLYLLKDQAIQLEEPNCRITDSHKFIPQSMRYGRFKLYLVDQAKSWNDTPLYIFDEWVSYRNGAMCLFWDATHGGTKDSNTDFIFGPMEFITYGVAAVMAASSSGIVTEELRAFTSWLLQDVFNIYYRAKQYAPWVQMDKLFDQLKNGADGQPIRQFMADTLSFRIPDGPVEPDLTLDWIM